MELNSSFMEEFLYEMEDLLLQIEQDCDSLNQEMNMDVVNHMFRAFHTMKGNSHMFGYKNLEQFVHVAEEIPAILREHNFNFCAGFDDIAPLVKNTLKLTLDDIRHGEEDRRCQQALPELEEKIKRWLSTQETLPSRVEDENRRLRFLVTEDDFTTRNQLTGFLSQYGDCHIAENGQAAVQAVLAKLDRDPRCLYDLICMDILMPKMNGLLATRKIRAIERQHELALANRTAKILIITSDDKAETISQACGQCQADGYLVKPLDIDLLSERLKHLSLLP